MERCPSPRHWCPNIERVQRGMSAAAAWKWIIFGFIGVLTGILAFGMTYITSKLYGVKFLLLKEGESHHVTIDLTPTRVIDNCDSCFWIPYLVLLSINAGAVLLSSCLVQFIEVIEEFKSSRDIHRSQLQEEVASLNSSAS